MMPGHFTPPLDSSLEWGTVGWDDSDTFYDLGDGSGTDSGIALVQVTLFRGKDPTVPLDETKAQGTKLLCQVGGSFLCIPPRGTKVLVATPHGFGDLPCASTIIQERDERAGAFYGGMAPGERCVAGLVGKARLLFKKNDSATLYTEDANGKAVTSYVGADKIQFTYGSASLILDENGITLAVGQAAIILGMDGSVKIQGQTVSASGSAVAISGKVATSIGAAAGSKTLIGPAATPATACGIGPIVPVGPLVAVSTSVFVSPT